MEQPLPVVAAAKQRDQDISFRTSQVRRDAHDVRWYGGLLQESLRTILLQAIFEHRDKAREMTPKRGDLPRISRSTDHSKRTRDDRLISESSQENHLGRSVGEVKASLRVALPLLPREQTHLQFAKADSMHVEEAEKPGNGLIELRERMPEAGRTEVHENVFEALVVQSDRLQPAPEFDQECLGVVRCHATPVMHRTSGS